MEVDWIADRATLRSLARDISFGHQGRFTDRGYDAQLNRASALSIIINAIVVWNTRHFDRAQTKLLEQGRPVDEAIWQHLSPLAWKHINLVGSYHFAEVNLQEEFRPLRESERMRKRIERASAEPADLTRPGVGEFPHFLVHPLCSSRYLKQVNILLAMSEEGTSSGGGHNEPLPCVSITIVF